LTSIDSCTSFNRNSNDIFPTATKTWSQLSPSGSTPAGRVDASSAVSTTDDKFYVFGGFNENEGYLNDMWQYDVSDNRWTELFANTNDGESGAGSLAVNSLLVFLVISLCVILNH
jgi:N-acetylneuraminic acid mutarotase